jgi:uncharacterized repeat protein (TIGR03803 family)
MTKEIGREDRKTQIKATRKYRFFPRPESYARHSSPGGCETQTLTKSSEPHDVAGEMKMTSTKIVFLKVAHSQRLKAFRASAALILATLMLVVAAATTVATAQTFTSLHSFDGTDGDPYAGLVQGTDGNLYGTTQIGGADTKRCGILGCGTVFKITPSGTLTTLHSFDGADGESPDAGLVQATNGNFYGTTEYGGANHYYGTVFKITPSGTLTTLYSFCSQTDCMDGGYPWAGLVRATNGNFYGMTVGGGASNGGTVFKITPSGRLTTLHSFDGADGESPYGGLVQATDGNYYGTTSAGTYIGAGTVFKIIPSGTLTTLYRFCSQTSCIDGGYPDAALVQDTNGKFYGTTTGGGASGACADGCGTVFSLSVALGPFVETNPTSGKVGAAVKILGTNLTGATSVTFNGTAAVFKVVSASLITTTVRQGATTGKVKVKTPKVTLKSNVVFRVTK